MTKPTHREPMSLASRAAIAAAMLVLTCATDTTRAADPDVRSIKPEGGQRGAEVEVRLSGQRLDKPLELVWYDAGITTLKLEEVDTEGKKYDQVKATIRIAPDAALGEHFARLRTASGWTDLRTFHVGALPVVDEKEPNSDFAQPQEVAFGSTVHGVADNEDVDFYAVDVKKGQRITAEVEGIRLGHFLFDSYVAILDVRRFELASSDDTALLKQDPYVSIVAPEDGRYVVMIRESSYAGNGNCRYRLHIGDLPRPTAVFPPGGQAGQSLKVLLTGDPTGPWEQDVKLPDQPVGDWSLLPTQGDKSAAAPFPYRVVDFPSALEAEPNNNRDQATKVDADLPLAFNGIIENEGDEDWFRFKAKKDVEYTFRVYSRSLGSPLDAVIWVQKLDGNQLQSSDDANESPDSALKFKLPEDGEYVLGIRDHLRQGGADYMYRIEVTPSKPRLTLSTPEVQRDDTQSRQFAAVPRGNRWVVMMRANRTDFGGPIDITAENLPAGVTMHAPRMPGNVGEYPVVFEAAGDAPLGSSLATVTGKHAENAQIAGPWVQDVEWVQGEPNRTPYYTSSNQKFAVAVCEPAPFKVRIEPPKTPLLRDGQTALKIVVERAAGFDEEIKVQLPFRSPGVGANNEVTIPKGQTEVMYPLNANGNAAEGEWPMVAMAFAGVGGGNLYVASEHTPLKVEPQYITGSIDLAVVEQGQTTQVLVKLNHNREFEGEARLELLGLPEGATTEPKQIKKGDEQVVFEVKTTDKTPVSQHKSLFCSLVLPINGAEVRQSLAGGGVLRVDKPRPAPAPQPEAKKDEPKKDEPKAEAPKEAPPKPLSRLEQLRLEAEQRAKKAAEGK